MSANKAFIRWHSNFSQDPEVWEEEILKIQRKFKKYQFSIYILNRKCLKIQHAFFKHLMRNQNDNFKIQINEMSKVNSANANIQENKSKTLSSDKNNTANKISSSKNKNELNKIESQSKTLISLLKQNLEVEHKNPKEHYPKEMNTSKATKVTLTNNKQSKYNTKNQSIIHKTYTPHGRIKDNSSSK